MTNREAAAYAIYRWADMHGGAGPFNAGSALEMVREMEKAVPRLTAVMDRPWKKRRVEANTPAPWDVTKVRQCMNPTHDHCMATPGDADCIGPAATPPVPLGEVTVCRTCGGQRDVIGRRVDCTECKGTGRTPSDETGGETR